MSRRVFNSVGKSREAFERQWRALAKYIFAVKLGENMENVRINVYEDDDSYMSAEFYRRGECIGIGIELGNSEDPTRVHASSDTYRGGHWSLVLEDATLHEIVEAVVREERTNRRWGFLPNEER